MFHSPQVGQRPIHLGDWAPQLWQMKTVLSFIGDATPRPKKNSRRPARVKSSSPGHQIDVAASERFSPVRRTRGLSRPVEIESFEAHDPALAAGVIEADAELGLDESQPGGRTVPGGTLPGAKI